MLSFARVNAVALATVSGVRRVTFNWFEISNSWPLPAALPAVQTVHACFFYKIWWCVVKIAMFFVPA